MLAALYGADAIEPDESWVEVRCKRIAVVGAGASGLSAAWALHRDPAGYAVTLIERNATFGGAWNTVYANNSTMDLAGHATRDYFNLYALAKTLNVSMEEAISGGTMVYFLNGTRYIFSQPGTVHRSILQRSDFVQFGDEVMRLVRIVADRRGLMNEAQLVTTTLRQFVEGEGFTVLFIDFYLDTCMRTYLTSAVTGLDMPVGLFFFLEDLFGVCTKFVRAQYRAFSHGAADMADTMVREMSRNRRMTLRSSSKILAVKHKSDTPVQLLIQGAGGVAAWEQFDQVIFSIHRGDVYKVLTNELSSPLPAPTLYKRIFGSLEYSNVVSVAHMDSALAESRMREFRDSDGCWNVERYSYVYNDSAQSALLFPTQFRSYDKCIRNLTGPFFTFRDDPATGVDPDPSTVLRTVHWSAARHTVDFYTSARNLHAVQGHHGMWFVAGDTSVNLMEFAVASGLVAAQAVGAAYPFEDDALASLSFMLRRSWLLYGINLPFSKLMTTRTNNRSSPCSRCI